MTGDLHCHWASFRSEFEDYLLATGIDKAEKPVQAATLRRLMGKDCHHVYKHNLGLTEEEQKDAGAILDKLGQYFTPSKNVIFERYVFGNLKQEDGESVDAFVTRLREKAATCEYGALRDELIRDRLVLGITDEGARRRMLREKDLKLEGAIDIVRAVEVLDNKLKSMSLSSSVPGESINVAYGQRPGRRPTGRPSESASTSAQPQRGTGGCKYCGTPHRRGRDLCPAFGKTCRLCGTANHFAKVCMKGGQQARQLNAVDDPSLGDPEDYGRDERDVYTAESLGAVNTQRKKWFVNLPLHRGVQRCQLDSGATCNVMSMEDKMRLAPKAPLQKSLARLRLYNSEWMSSIGVYSTQCVIRGKTHRLDFEVVCTSQKPLLSGETCERLGLMRFTIPEELNKVEHCKAGELTRDCLINTYNDVFTSPVESLPGDIHFVLDSTVVPVQCAPRNVPVALKAAVKAQLDQYEKDGHLTTVTEPTDWISNLVIVKKPDKLRLCIDPKPLNRALKRSHYLMPTLDDVLYKLPKARVFTLVDARDAFLQCRLDEESSLMTTFWTPWGRKRWLKLPFGVSVAPELYQRKQHELLAGLKGIEPIADDILVVGCGDTEEEAVQDHDANLIALMERCREVKLRLSIKKLQFRVREVRFHGHVLSAEGLKADPEKVRAVLDMPNPTDAKGVQRCVGFVNYLSRFMPRLSEVCEPLRRLLDKEVPWHWLPKHDAAMTEIKTLVTAVPVLRYYDVSKPVTIQSDSSQTGLGCCLLQGGQPVAFASRALNQTEQNYAQIEKECLSIVFACQRFHYYLYGRGDVTAETDHRPLVSIFSKPLLSAPKRLQSMLLTLQNYCLTVVYKPGPEMYISDTLSRAPTPPQRMDIQYRREMVCSMQQEQCDTAAIQQADYLNVTCQRLAQIRKHTEEDVCLQTLKSVVLGGWPEHKEESPMAIRDYWAIRDEISAQDGVLFRSQRVIIPKSMRPEMLRRIHYNHVGGEACFRQARDTLYWPNMQGEIKDYVQQCSVCNEYAHEQQKETMMSHPLPTRPWQLVSMDLFSYARQDFLLMVDHYSDFWEIDLLPDLSAGTAIRRCKAQFARYGIPDRVISDCGGQFDCGEFRVFAREWSFEHVMSSPRHPKANGKAESAVKIAKSLCRKADRADEDPWKAFLHWRNTPTEGMHSSPAQRLMSRRLRTLLPVADQLLEPQVTTGVTDRLRVKRQATKLTYDRSARDLPELNVGQPIRMKPLPGDRTGRWRRGVCLQQVGPRSYLVNVEGTAYRRNRIDLRPAEVDPPQPAAHEGRPPEQPVDAGAADGGHAGGANAEEVVSSPATSPRLSALRSPPSPSRAVSTPCRALQGRACSRSGRHIKPPDRLDL